MVITAKDLNLFHGSTTIPDVFLLDVKAAKEVPNNIFNMIVEKTINWSFKQKDVTITDFNIWTKTIEYDEERIKIIMRFIIFVTRRKTLLRLSDEGFASDLQKLELPQEKITALLEKIKAASEFIEKEVFKGEGFKLPNYTGITWRLDFKIRDEYREEIVKPVILIDISYDDREHSEDRRVIFEINEKELETIITCLQDAHTVIKKAQMLEEKILRLWSGEGEN